VAEVRELEAKLPGLKRYCELKEKIREDMLQVAELE
jgi:hypothetical protein